MKIPQMVFELQSGHDFVTDRWTDDQDKNNMSPNPTGGDIIIQIYILSKSMHIQNLIEIHELIHKIRSINKILTSIKGHNSVKN